MMHPAWTRHLARRHGSRLEGQRIIERQPTAPDAQRWDGYIDHDPGQRHWVDSTVENVIRTMNEAVGPVPDAAYEVRE